MNDIQKLFDAITTTARDSRSNYHLTLGGLMAALDAMPDNALVVCDDGTAIGDEHSYRGYYADLAFKPAKEASVGDVRVLCERAISQSYTGYKGGEFCYDADTPLWRATYGCTGEAIISATQIDGKLVLGTKEID